MAQTSRYEEMFKEGGNNDWVIPEKKTTDSASYRVKDGKLTIENKGQHEKHRGAQRKSAVHLRENLSAPPCDVLSEPVSRKILITKIFFWFVPLPI